jgi:hypothetical protein
MKRCLVCLGLALVATNACTKKTFGNGIGRPPVTSVDRPHLVPVTLAEIYTAGGPSGHYADLLLAAGADALDLTGFELCDSRSYADDACVTLSGTLDPGARRHEMLAKLNLLATAGELGLVDADGVVHAYVAWGADPATVGSALAAAATVDGATSPGAFIAIPYPMPAGLAVARASDLEGCVAAGLATPADPVSCPTVPPVLALTEVLSRFEESGDSWVELTNLTLDALPLYGVRLCQLPDCLVFERDQVIGAQSPLLVHFGIAAPAGSPPPDELFFPGLAAISRASELALIAPGSADPTGGAGLQAFVRFGAAPSELASIAANVGFWPEPLATARTARVAGESLSHDLSTARSDTAWHPAVPTPLAENLDIQQNTDLWDSCSFPRPWRDAPAFGLAIYRVARSTPSSVDLLNRTSDNSTVSLATLSLAVNGQSFPLAACGEVAAGGLLTVRLLAGTDPPACVDGELHVSGAPLDASGEVALVDTNGTAIVRHYLRWGDGTSTGVAAAVLDGAWPLDRCSLPTLDADQSLTLGADMSGHAPPDYE